jgi:DNA mismatch repair protein MSH4
VLIDRRYFAETTGLEYIQQLAFLEDLDALKKSLEGNYFAACCAAAVSVWIDSVTYISLIFFFRLGVQIH